MDITVHTIDSNIVSKRCYHFCMLMVFVCVSLLQSAWNVTTIIMGLHVDEWYLFKALQNIYVPNNQSTICCGLFCCLGNLRPSSHICFACVAAKISLLLLGLQLLISIWVSSGQTLNCYIDTYGLHCTHSSKYSIHLCAQIQPLHSNKHAAAKLKMIMKTKVCLRH